MSIGTEVGCKGIGKKNKKKGGLDLKLDKGTLINKLNIPKN